MTALADQADPSLGIGASSLRNELMMSQDSLRALSEETGGFAAVNTNQFANAFDRIVTDNSTYYVLAYYPPTDKKDGKFHRIEVKVTRPGLTVRARRGYMAPKPKPAPKTTAKDGPSAQVVEALDSPLNVSGLGMRIFAAPFKGAAPNASVLIGVEVVGRDLALGPNTKVELSYLAVDAKGKSFGAKTDTLTLNLRPETRTRVEGSGIRILNRMDLPPGRYQVRVAIPRRRRRRRIGHLRSRDSRLPEAAVQHERPAPHVDCRALRCCRSRADEQTRTVMPAPPVAQRTFPQNDEIALFTEIYDDGTAPRTRWTSSPPIRSDEGTIFFKNEEERDSKELEGKRGGYGYTARIPLTGLAPGPYVLSVEARSRLRNNLVASRQIRINVVPAPTAGREARHSGGQCLGDAARSAGITCRSAPTPTFSAGVEVVEVDVIVTDRPRPARSAI